MALSDSDSGGIVLACSILAVAAIAGSMAAVWLRRWAREESDVGATGGFSLIELRALLRQGKLTNEEFERMRAMIVDAAKKSPESSDTGPKPNQ